MTPGKPHSLQERLQEFWPVLFFAVLYFMCSCDTSFSFRIHDLNFRFGQFLLLAVSLVALWPIVKNRVYNPEKFGPYGTVLKNWVFFFMVYALAAAFAESHFRTFLKLGWAIFNIGGAALLCLNSRFGDWVKKGIFWGVTAIALVIWLEFLLIYCFTDYTTYTGLDPGQVPQLWFHGHHIAIVQFAGDQDGIKLYRPHAFFYEPSYAGCALVFALPIVIAMGFEKPSSFFRSVFIPAFILLASMMPISRTAILGEFISFTTIFGLALIKKKPQLAKTIVKICLTTLLLFGLLAISPRTRAYATFLVGPMGPSGVVSRVSDANSSEGWRLANIEYSLRIWMNHPILGIGVPSPTLGNGIHGMGQSSENMWLEVALESGTLGLLGFLFGIFKSVADAFKACRRPEIIYLVTGALTAHLLVSMNFTSTFPRLDYWIIFFLAISLLTAKSSPGK